MEHNNEIQEEIQAVTLEDSQGNEITFEVMATTEYNDKEYIILLPLEEYGDPDEYTILELRTEGEDSRFIGIDDMNTLMAVYKKFCQEADEEE